MKIKFELFFLRITFCDFKIRNLGDNIHQHSVQCALPINLFNEKFFIVLWFWLIFLTVVTIFNFISWIKTMFPLYRRNSIAKYLRVHGKLLDSEKEQEMFEIFVNDYCYLDGAFIFQILRRNSNYITTSEVICALWSIFSSEKYVMNYRNDARVSKNVDEVEIGMENYEETPEKKPLRFVPNNTDV